MDVPTSAPKRVRSLIRRQDWSAGAIARRYPATIVLGGIVAIMGLVTQHHGRAQMNRLMERFGVTWDSLMHARLWTIPVSTFMQSDPGFPWLILFFVLTSLIAIETLAGSKEALVTFLASDWISGPLTAVVLRIAAAFGSNEARLLLSDGSTGSSAAFHGCFAAAAMLLPKKWADRMLIPLAVNVIAQFAYERLDDATAHAIATIVGAMLARLVWARTSNRAPVPSIGG